MSVESLQSQEEYTSSETKLLASKPNPGKMINNFVTRLKSLAEYCDYGKEEDNQVRDIVISNNNRHAQGRGYFLMGSSCWNSAKFPNIVCLFH